MTTSPGPSLKYPGAKWRAVDWILPHLPPHTTYVEPYFGSGAVFFSKPPSASEYINDLNGDIANLFQVMREQPAELANVVELTAYARDEYALSLVATDDPLERARRTLVRHWQSVGAKSSATSTAGWRHSGVKDAHKRSCPREWARLPERILAHARRLKMAHIENRPALEVLGRLNAASTLAYIDPPYHPGTRASRMYACDMLEEEQHLELLTFLTGDWRGMAVVSGYAHPLYEELLAGWERTERRMVADAGQTRTEVLWINPAAAHRGLFTPSGAP